jgi:exonuclease III
MSRLVKSMGMKMAVFNCRSLSAASLGEICDWMVVNKISVLGAVDVRIPPGLLAKVRERRAGFRFIANCPSTKVAGIVTIVGMDAACTNERGGSSETEDRGLIVADGDGRLVCNDIVTHGKYLRICVIYCPAQPAQWVTWVTAMINAFRSNPLGSDIIAGDFNCTLAPGDRGSRKPPPRIVRELFPRLLAALGHGDQTNFIDLWRTLNPDVEAYTHYNSAGGESRIDRIYVPETWALDTLDSSIDPIPVASDHRVVSLHLRMPGEARGPGRWRLKPLTLRQPIVKRALRGVFPEDGSKQWGEIKSEVSAVLAEVGEARLSNRHRALKKLGVKRTKLQAKLASSGKRPEMERALTALMSKEDALTREDILEYSHSVMAKFGLLNERPTKWFFNRMAVYGSPGITEIHTPDGPDILSTEGILDSGVQFYTALYSRKPSDRNDSQKLLRYWNMKIMPRDQASLIAPFRIRELVAQIRKQEVGKAPGNDGLVAEWYKSLVTGNEQETPNPKLTPLLEKLNAVLDGAPPGDGWTDGALSVLWKNKGDRGDWSSYRPLTIMNVDYKLLTGMLAARLTSAVEPLIGDPQVAFLPKRLMDDHIRTVQLLIDEYEGSETDGFWLLFLDGEKAYDRVSHTWLWRALDYIAVPPKLITCLQNLYRGAKVNLWNRGFVSDDIPVRSGVRQGDPLSCILYVIAIEPLSRWLSNCPGLKGVKVGDVEKAVTCLLFADDTTVLFKTQEEANLIVEILGVFERATGQKMNWPKCKLMRVGRPPTEVVLPEVEVLGIGQPYEYLGVPVGVQIGGAILAKWNSILSEIRTIANKWGGAHMSMRGRVLIAGTLLISRVRFLMRFCALPRQVRKDLLTIYWGLVWDGKERGVVSRELAVSGIAQGGLKCVDLDSITKANAIAAIHRAEGFPHLAWAQFLGDMLRRAPSRTKYVKREVLSKPWFQRVSARQATGPKSFAHLLTEWRRLLGNALAGKPGPLYVGIPRDERELEMVEFWYHPMLDITRGQGAKRWNAAAWTHLLERGCRTIGDLLKARDDRTWLDSLPRSQPSVGEVIDGLLADFPAQWGRLGTEAKEPFRTGYLRIRGEPRAKALVRFSKAYQACVREVTEGVCEWPILKEVQSAARRMVNREIPVNALWRRTRDPLVRLKVGDLLWRFLHDKVNVGSELEFLHEEKKFCPVDGLPLTVTHLWVDCPCALAVWDCLRGILGRFSSPCYQPRSKVELITLFAVPYGDTRIQRQRWQVFYSEALWAIWRCYLSWSFEEDLTAFSAPKAVRQFQEQLAKRCMSDRALATCPIRATKSCNSLVFARRWGIKPWEVKTSQALWFME